MKNDYPAKTSISINAPMEKVWDALTNPAIVKQYMFGTDVISNWQKDKPIIFKGEWQGKQYEDKGIIKKIDPPILLEYTHWSNLSGKPDTEENQNVITIQLTDEHGSTHVSLIQTNNPTDEAREHSQQMWDTALASMKKVVENGAANGQ
jgi:uncharacterized protein YndB with AHSA1/START domain